jgi:hypothetical protein
MLVVGIRSRLRRRSLVIKWDGIERRRQPTHALRPAIVGTRINDGARWHECVAESPTLSGDPKSH